MSVWQPIATAPKDGSEIDVWTVRDHRAAGHQERRWCYVSWWGGDQFQDGAGHWMAEEDDGPLMVERDGWTATHWMPAPDGPQ